MSIEIDRIKYLAGVKTPPGKEYTVEKKKSKKRKKKVGSGTTDTDGVSESEIQCESCDGSGYANDDEICGHCGGKGVLSEGRWGNSYGADPAEYEVEGETVDTSLRRYLDAKGHPVTVNDDITEATLAKRFAKFKKTYKPVTESKDGKYKDYSDKELKDIVKKAGDSAAEKKELKNVQKEIEKRGLNESMEDGPRYAVSVNSKGQKIYTGQDLRWAEDPSGVEPFMVQGEAEKVKQNIEAFDAPGIEVEVIEIDPDSGSRPLDETAYEKDLDPDKRVVVKGVKGMNSKQFTKKFPNKKAADKWLDSDKSDDYEVKQIMNESADEASGKFKRGDRVKVSDNISSPTLGKYAGKTGKVLKVVPWSGVSSRKPSYMVKINRAKAPEVEFDEHELQKVNVNESSKPTGTDVKNLKVGQRILSNDRNHDPLKITGKPEQDIGGHWIPVKNLRTGKKDRVWVDYNENVELDESSGASLTKGDKVIVKNAKKYDALAKSNEVEGVVDAHFPSGRVAVRVGSGQMNVDKADLVKKSVTESEKSIGDVIHKGDKVYVATQEPSGQHSFANPAIGKVLKVNDDNTKALIQYLDDDDGRTTISTDKLRKYERRVGESYVAEEFKPAFSHKDNKAFFNNLAVMSEVYGKMKAGRPLNQREKYWFKGKDEKSIEEELVDTITKILRNSIILGSKKKITPSKEELHKMFDLKKVALDNLDKWKKKTSAKEVLGGIVTQYLEKMGRKL